jgi:hypothetical protein
MTRYSLQAALCVTLCPLLVAQQVRTEIQRQATQPPAQATAVTTSAQPESITIPKDTRIELIALEEVRSEAAKKRSTVSFAVAKDVVVNGVTVLRAGAPVNGVVSKAKRGVPDRHDGRLDIRVKEIGIGSGAKVRLTNSDSKTRQAWDEQVKGTLELYGLCALGLPLCLVLIAALRDGGPRGPREPPIGYQAVMPQCHAVDYWVKSATEVKATDLPQSNVVSEVPDAEGCSSRIDVHAKAQASSYLEGVKFK